MRNTTAFAHINSLKGEKKEVQLLGPHYKNGRIENNFYVFKVDDKLCVGLLNWFVCEYYVDDLYAVLAESDENYKIYKEFLQ